jgi:glucosamine-6-phosphate deaminase
MDLRENRKGGLRPLSEDTKYAHKLVPEDLENDEYCSLIPGLSLNTVADVIESTKRKIEAGLRRETEHHLLHTGPHHDDIMLGIFPAIIPQLREITNKFHFSVLTSGFTAVTNSMLLELLEETQRLISQA